MREVTYWVLPASRSEEPPRGLVRPFIELFDLYLRDFPHSTELCGEACPHSSEAYGGEDLDIEEPVSGWDCSTLHFHATLAGMLSATLIRNKVV